MTISNAFFTAPGSLEAASINEQSPPKLAKNDIPQDPAGPPYRQGNTLEAEHTHWCRATFYQQYRLFFRYDLASKILIYAWVNDQSTKRAYV